MKITKNCMSVVVLFAIPLLLISCKHQLPSVEFKLTHGNLPPTFLMGSHLCRYPMPSAKEMLADMDNLKKHGFNLIKLQTHWAVDEPLEGKYEFNRYDSLLQHAKD